MLVNCWTLLVIADHKNPVRLADNRLTLWLAPRVVFVVSNCHEPKEQREQSQACLSYAESRLRKTKSMPSNLHEMIILKILKRNIPGKFLTITGDSWLQKQSACGRVVMEWFRKRNVFVWSEMARNDQEFVRNLFFESSSLVMIKKTT